MAGLVFGALHQIDFDQDSVCQPQQRGNCVVPFGRGGAIQIRSAVRLMVERVPRHVGTGGKTQQLGISKRGNTYLRTLLIAGARAVIARSGKSDGMERLLQRRHHNTVVVALANKMARTAWAVLARGMAFDRTRWNPLEAVTA
ncbi:transposase [Acidovorax sp. 69]|uniref:transposase n=1 Tax=Acidovorax sp. 69 TaxID=2035202 RepID=UPI0035142D81